MEREMQLKVGCNQTKHRAGLRLGTRLDGVVALVRVQGHDVRLEAPSGLNAWLDSVHDLALGVSRHREHLGPIKSEELVDEQIKKDINAAGKLAVQDGVSKIRRKRDSKVKTREKERVGGEGKNIKTSKPAHTHLSVWKALSTRLFVDTGIV